MSRSFNISSFRESGMTLIEVLFASLILAVVSLVIFEIFMKQSSFRSESIAKLNSENTILTLVLKLESEYRTTLQGSNGTKLVSNQEFYLNRMNPNDATKYSRVVYKAKCEAIPNGAILNAGLKTFARPAECVTSGVDNKPICEDGYRPVIEMTSYPNFSGSSSSTVSVEPKYDGVSTNGGSLYEQPIALTMCLTSPISSELDLISGYFFAYYANTGKKIAVVKRKFMISRTPSLSGVQYIPN